ncbi:MAG: HEPN domain-containing protein [Methanobrevibacter sp.]|nr:HEPN domain-containing protein [Methanobrevibacter sp.]
MEESELFIKEASERLINAKILFDNERYNLCISEVYYSMFFSVKALLKLKNKNSQTCWNYEVIQ